MVQESCQYTQLMSFTHRRTIPGLLFCTVPLECRPPWGCILNIPKPDKVTELSATCSASTLRMQVPGGWRRVSRGFRHRPPILRMLPGQTGDTSQAAGAGLARVAGRPPQASEHLLCTLLSQQQNPTPHFPNFRYPLQPRSWGRQRARLVSISLGRKHTQSMKLIPKAEWPGACEMEGPRGRPAP